MAPYKRPRSLREISLVYMAHLVRDTCERIVWAESLDRLAAANEVGSYLRSVARPMMTELATFAFTRGLAVESLYDSFVKPPHSSGQETPPCDSVSDVMLVVFAHPQLKSLDFRCDRICASHFSLLTGLIKLDLGFLVTLADSTMDAIVRHCTRLEVIAFNFRLASLHAIGQLKVLKSLRVIKDSCAQCCFDGQERHLTLLRTLLAELPNLEHISCKCIGVVLDGLDLDHPLALTDVREKNLDQKLDTVARLCPRLERLTFENNRKRVVHLTSDFTPLSDSSIKLSHLVLASFTFSSNIEDFFRIKGIHLKKLFLRDCFHLDVDDVKLIGRCCRFLEKLDICCYNGVFTDVPTKDYDRDGNSEVIFQHLLELSCNGLSLLPICLTHAKSIESVLVIWLHTSRPGDSETQKTFTDLIAVNPMTRLQCLGLYALDIVLSTDLIKYFYTLPCITKMAIFFLKYNPELNKLIVELNREISVHNLNINLECKFSSDSSEEEENVYL